jgi:hypothetical protein
MGVLMKMSFKKEFKKERKEHPSFTDAQIKQIVKDHRFSYGKRV